MEISFQKSVGEVVALDYRAAAIFEKYGIDFCCKGHTTIDEACESKNVMTEDVMRDLKMLHENACPAFTDYRAWSPALLVDYIEEKHHSYIVQKTPVILRYLDKLCKAHGDRHPELHEVNRHFRESASDLAKHLKKEELILFPRIRQLVGLGHNNQGHFMHTMVEQPIHVMMQEHAVEGERFKAIEILTDHYRPPDDACNTYRVTFALLQEFENDLHLHIHLENNVLFPKAMELEKELMN